MLQLLKFEDAVGDSESIDWVVVKSDQMGLAFEKNGGIFGFEI